MRVIAVTFCVTLAASLAARLGPTEMAAFQVCLQVWLATSLLADGLAVAGQVIQIFLSFAESQFLSTVSNNKTARCYEKIYSKYLSNKVEECLS